jgi:hypothetical protein
MCTIVNGPQCAHFLQILLCDKLCKIKIIMNKNFYPLSTITKLVITAKIIICYVKKKLQIVKLLIELSKKLNNSLSEITQQFETFTRLLSSKRMILLCYFVDRPIYLNRADCGYCYSIKKVLVIKSYVR